MWQLFSLCVILALFGCIAGGVNYFFNKAIVRKRHKDGVIQQINPSINWNLHAPSITSNLKWLLRQNIEQVFITSFDGLKLSGTFFPASAESKKIIIAVHGYHSKGISDYASISQFYHRLGYNMLIVDDRSHGNSEGEYIGFGCLDRFDCIKWIEYINNRYNDNCSIFLHGISMGAATIMMARGQPLSPNVHGMICDCGFTSAFDVFAHLLKKHYHIPPFPILYLTSMMCRKIAGYGFDECSVLEEINKSNVPILIIHGNKDDFVPTRMANEIYDICMSPKKLVIIDGADHAECYYVNTILYENEVKEFLQKYR